MNAVPKSWSARAPGIVVALLALVLLCAPSLQANVSPEAALLVHVDPVTPEFEWCWPLLSDCDDVQRRVEDCGLMSFEIYFDAFVFWGYDETYMDRFEADITLPETWQVIDAVMPAWGNVSIYPAGSGVHHLEVEWWEDVRVPEYPDDGLVPIACIGIDAPEPGRFDFVERWMQPVYLRGQSGSFEVYANTVDAEVASGCEYGAYSCGGYYGSCEATFGEDELRLSAPLGGTAHGSVPVHWWGLPCNFHVDAEADWCTAEIKGYSLLVAVDATSLPPGVHETEIQVSEPHEQIARCLPVYVTVDDNDPTPVVPVSWGRLKAHFR